MLTIYSFLCDLKYLLIEYLEKSKQKWEIVSRSASVLCERNENRLSLQLFCVHVHSCGGSHTNTRSFSFLRASATTSSMKIANNRGCVASSMEHLSGRALTRNHIAS